MEPGVGLDETLDAICAGSVRVLQRRRGYRFAVDSLLLGHFAGNPRGRVCDLGTGSGVIPLMVAHHAPQASVVGIELQEALCRLARRNVTLNRAADRIEVVQADLRCLATVLAAESFDVVVSNPPYHPPLEGFVSPVFERALARHEITCSLADVVAGARYLLRANGRFKIVFPASRLGELVAELRTHGLEPKRLRLVHPRLSMDAKLVLCESVKGGRCELAVLPPLVLGVDADRCEMDAAGDGDAAPARAV